MCVGGGSTYRLTPTFCISCFAVLEVELRALCMSKQELYHRITCPALLIFYFEVSLHFLNWS